MIRAIFLDVDGTLITFTGYSGLDPDFINTNIWNSGTDSFSYPNTRSVMFGLDLTF